MSQSGSAIIAAIKTMVETATGISNVSDTPRHSVDIAEFPAVDIGWMRGHVVYEITQEYEMRDMITLKLYSNKPDFSQAQSELRGFYEDIADALAGDATLGDVCTGCWISGADTWLGFINPYLMFIALECSYRRDYP